MRTLLAQVLTVLLGFVAARITIKPPSPRPQRDGWIALFARLTAAVVIGTVVSAGREEVEKGKLTDLVGALRAKLSSYTHRMKTCMLKSTD
jgi:hypothetical protein